MIKQLFLVGAILPLGWAPLQAQSVLDRAAPSKIAPPVRAERANGGPTLMVPAEASPQSHASIPGVRVGAIVLTGLTRLKNADFSDILERYMGQSLSPAELGELTGKISARARQKGYTFSEASVAPQNLTAGILRIDVDEGRIDDVRLEGSDSKAVRQSLQALVGKGPISIQDVERHLLIAGDLAGVTIKQSRYVRESGRGILILNATQKRLAVYAGIDNSGSKAVGPLQADLTVVATHLLAADDSVTATVLMTPADPQELRYGRVKYVKRVNSDGTEATVAIAYSSSKPGSVFRSSNVRGTSFQATATVVRPIQRTKKSGVWAQAGISYDVINQDAQGFALRRDRILTQMVGLYGVSAFAGGRLNANVTLSHGELLEGSAVLLAGYIIPHSFTTALLGADWTTASVAGLSARIALATQIASGPLPPSAQLALGGSAFGRGYNYGERLGDEGSMSLAELRFDVARALGPLLHPQLYSFVDGGKVVNLAGSPAGDALFSSGVGIRAGIGSFGNADLGLAFPLSGPRYDSLSQVPRVNFRMTESF